MYIFTLPSCDNLSAHTAYMCVCQTSVHLWSFRLFNLWSRQLHILTSFLVKLSVYVVRIKTVLPNNPNIASCPTRLSRKRRRPFDYCFDQVCCLFLTLMLLAARTELSCVVSSFSSKRLRRVLPLINVDPQ